MSDAADLRARAEGQSAHLPPLLIRARQLAGTVMGAHGRRRAGPGDDFWQYRPVQPGDERRMIDWRRSARSDAEFVRQKEWQIAQNVTLWADQGAAMGFASKGDLPPKSDRARLLAMALAVLLARAGERVGLAGPALPPGRGAAQLGRIAAGLLAPGEGEHAAPALPGRLRGQAVFLSDFLGELAPIRAAMTRISGQGGRGVLLQILDPAEEAFPYRGRVIFQSMGGGLRHETLKADALQARYLARLAQRKAELQSLCRACGWHYGLHHTSAPAQAALLWLYRIYEAEIRQ